MAFQSNKNIKLFHNIQSYCIFQMTYSPIPKKRVCTPQISPSFNTVRKFNFIEERSRLDKAASLLTNLISFLTFFLQFDLLFS